MGRVRNALKRGANIAKWSAVGAMSVFGLATAQAQDFYDACRGPQTFQMDVRADYHHVDGVGGVVDGLVIPKFFPKLLNEDAPNLAFLFPIGFSSNGDESALGLNAGWLVENYGRKKLPQCILPMVGLFDDGSGSFSILSPQSYATKLLGERGQHTIDAYAQYLTHTDSNVDFTLWKGALTYGYAPNAKWRVGGSALFEEGKRPDFQGIVRFDVRKGFGLWIEGFIREEGEFGTRMVYSPTMKRTPAPNKP